VALPPIGLAPESALGSVPTVALSSAQVADVVDATLSVTSSFSQARYLPARTTRKPGVKARREFGNIFG
jgi:hypothetical protein